jgi:hypothetical protein
MGPGQDPHKRRFINMFSIAPAASNIGNLKGVDQMEKKLFRVKVTLYVMAENESEACAAATNARFDIFECAAKKAKQLDPGWETAIPYNAQDHLTCAEILARLEKVTQSAFKPTSTRERWQTRVQTSSNYAEAQATPG